MEDPDTLLSVSYGWRGAGWVDMSATAAQLFALLFPLPSLAHLGSGDSLSTDLYDIRCINIGHKLFVVSLAGHL